MTLYNEALSNDGLAAAYTPETIYNHSGVNPYRYPSVDYYSSEYLKNSFSRYDGVAEISGGTTVPVITLMLGSYLQVRCLISAKQKKIIHQNALTSAEMLICSSPEH